MTRESARNARTIFRLLKSIDEQLYTRKKFLFDLHTNDSNNDDDDNNNSKKLRLK